MATFWGIAGSTIPLHILYLYSLCNFILRSIPFCHSLSLTSVCSGVHVYLYNLCIQRVKLLGRFILNNIKETKSHKEEIKAGNNSGRA